MPKDERTHKDLIRAETDSATQNFVIGKIYKCPVMYLNKSDDSKQRPVVILSIMTEGNNSYGLILGSSKTPKADGKYLVPWKMTVKTPYQKVVNVSHFDFSRFIRTIDLKKLNEFYDGNREQVYLSDKTLNDIRTKLDSALFMSTLSTKDVVLNSINWNIYDTDNLINEHEEKINFNNVFSFLENKSPQEKKYVLILNKFSQKASNSLVLLLSSEKPPTKYCFALHSFKENPKFNKILYGDLRTVTTIAINTKCLINSAFASVTNAEVAFIKGQVKKSINLLTQLPNFENTAYSNEWACSAPPPSVWGNTNASTSTALSCDDWPAIATSVVCDDKNKGVATSNLDVQTANSSTASFANVDNKLLHEAQTCVTNEWQVTPILLAAKQSPTSTEMNWESFDKVVNIPKTIAAASTSTFDELRVIDCVKPYDVKQIILTNNDEVVKTSSTASSRYLPS